MGFVYPNLCRELDEMGISVEVLAEKLNIPEESLCSKLSGNTPWRLGEVIHICKLVKKPDAKFLFLQLDNN